MVLIAATGSLGCESRSGEPPVSQTVLPIVGGNLATACQWPTAIMLVEESVGCSGALVHPRVVVTAAHCLAGEGSTPSAIGLGETRSAWAKTVAVSDCYTHPVNDFGICILAEDVTSIPIVPVMAPCEMSELTAGVPVVEVGFGVTGATDTTYGTKKWIGGFVASAAPGEVDVNVTTGSQDGEYYGDSGGPLFFQMPDRTWRIVGEDWGSPNIDDTHTPRVSTYKSVPYHVAWAEQVSGIDLTPCHDANGWNPTAACTGVPTNPGEGVGSWAMLCQGETMSRQPTCQAVPPNADAGGELAEAGADSSGGDGLTNGSGDTDSRDCSTGDIQADINGDSDTGRAYGDVDTSDSRQMGNATDSGKAGVDAPGPAGDSPAGSGGSAGTGGGSADGSGGESEGGAGGSSTVQSAHDAGVDGASEGKASDSGGPGSTSDGGDTGPGLGSDSGRDAGADLSAVNDGKGSSVDGGIDQEAGRRLGSGCTCRSVSDRNALSWPSFGLLGVALIAARLIRRRTR